MTAEGVGDRLRTAAFAELQAREAFAWAAARFPDAPCDLRENWRRLSAEEHKHLGWIVGRMDELGVKIDQKPVSDALYRSLTRCVDWRQFARFMARAEDRGRTAERRFQQALVDLDPQTAAIFERIALEEDSHIALQSGF